MLASIIYVMSSKYCFLWKNIREIYVGGEGQIEHGWAVKPLLICQKRLMVTIRH